MKKPRTVDLFAGCGGLSLGFQQAGFCIVAAFEWWDAAIKCYEQNFDHPVFKCDLSDIEQCTPFIQGFKPELIIGGPPCQDFSSAGKREEKERANLTVCYAEIITKILPPVFVMENVDRAKDSKAFAMAEKIYKNAGYGLTKILLNASLCGVPQRRKRFFCIGILNGKDNQLLDSIRSDLTMNETTLREYFADSLGFEYFYRHPRNYNRRAVFSIDEPAPTMRGVNRPIPKGYTGHPDDACPLGPKVHALTTRDRALIQTFPANFIWEGSKTDCEQMIGNAVPVGLARFVASHVMELFQPSKRDEDSKQMKLFHIWLHETQKLKPRSADDVISRIKRVIKLTGSILTNNEKEACFAFDKAVDGIGLSVSVKSQMKRAIRLFCKWKSEGYKNYSE